MSFHLTPFKMAATKKTDTINAKYDVDSKKLLHTASGKINSSS